jgi:hypothetical protein
MALDLFSFSDEADLSVTRSKLVPPWLKVVQMGDISQGRDQSSYRPVLWDVFQKSFDSGSSVKVQLFKRVCFV